MHYYIGVDLGTSGTKTVLYTAKGQALASHTVEYPLYQYQNGWAEQDPQDWANAAYEGIQSVLKTSTVNAADIQALGISGQMHGAVLLDKDGNVLRKAILWCDGRTVPQCEEIHHIIGKERLVEICANPALPGFTAGKIRWVQQNEPEIFAKTACILLPKDYVRYCLTGVLCQEYSDASGTNLLDIYTRTWSKEILQALQIPESILPPLYESLDIVGTITEQAGQRTGLAMHTKVIAGAGDNAAAAIGTGISKVGDAFITIGTSGVIFAHADEVHIDPECRVHTFCSAIPKAFAVMSCTLSAGLSYRWLRDTVFSKEIEQAKAQGIDPYVLMNELAKDSPIGANKLLFLPYLMGERSPLLDANARGVFFGLSAMHGKGDLSRAVMEGVSYSQKACLDVIQGMGIEINSLLACGGGARSPLWRQMLADILRCPLQTATQSNEGPALGVMILSAVACGEYSSIEEACKAIIEPNSTTSPQHSEAYEVYYQLFKALYPSLQTHFAQLSAL